MALFDGVYIENQVLAAGLDLIRYLAEPDYFRRTHITVRGPYKKRLGKRFEGELAEAFDIKNRELEIQGIGAFLFGTQNTVFLKCELPSIFDVWHKPDFRGGVPHLTLYDGESRLFANALKKTLSENHWKFTAMVSELVPIEKKKQPDDFLEIYFERAVKMAEDAFKFNVAFSEIKTLSDLDRLTLVAQLSTYINKNARSWTKTNLF